MEVIGRARGDCTLWGCCLSPVHTCALPYGITVFITLFKCLSQGFSAVGIYNILIKYAGARNQDRGLKPKRDLAGR